MTKTKGSGGRLLRLGSALLILAAIGILPAAFVIAFQPRLGLNTQLGRHVFAGGLGLAGLSILLAATAAIPLRRGERWAFWAYAGAFLLLGLPVVAADALNVGRASLWLTLLPQVLGLLVATLGLALCAQELFAGE